jgi:hypothetical protein
MAQHTIIYGYIQGAEWMSSDIHRLHRLNRETIAALPSRDTFPDLSRGMFTVPDDAADPAGARNQIIHFGAAIYEVELEWRKWLEKFESLLRKLYWFNAVVQLRTEMIGDHLYEWTVDANQIVHFFNDPPRPATKWYFDGGPRDFDL